MQIGKLAEWAVEAFRAVGSMMGLVRKLLSSSNGKPVFLGRATRVEVECDKVMEFGFGEYIVDRCRLQVCSESRMGVGAGCYLNTNWKMIVAECKKVDAYIKFAPNVCVVDQSNIFYPYGVRAILLNAAIGIVEHCWRGANALVAKGDSLSDKLCVQELSSHASWQNLACIWGFFCVSCVAPLAKAVS